MKAFSRPLSARNTSKLASLLVEDEADEDKRSLRSTRTDINYHVVEVTNTKAPVIIENTKSDLNDHIEPEKGTAQIRVEEPYEDAKAVVTVKNKSKPLSPRGISHTNLTTTSFQTVGFNLDKYKVHSSAAIKEVTDSESHASRAGTAEKI